MLNKCQRFGGTLAQTQIAWLNWPFWWSTVNWIQIGRLSSIYCPEKFTQLNKSFSLFYQVKIQSRIFWYYWFRLNFVIGPIPPSTRQPLVHNWATLECWSNVTKVRLKDFNFVPTSHLYTILCVKKSNPRSLCALYNYINTIIIKIKTSGQMNYALHAIRSNVLKFWMILNFNLSRNNALIHSVE